MNIKELEQKRDAHMTGLFWLALHIAFIFAIPAVLAALIGKKLNTVLGISWMQFALLLVAFISSWGIMAHQYEKKTKAMKEIEEELKIARAKVAKESPVSLSLTDPQK